MAKTMGDTKAEGAVECRMGEGEHERRVLAELPRELQAVPRCRYCSPSCLRCPSRRGSGTRSRGSKWSSSAH